MRKYLKPISGRARRVGVLGVVPALIAAAIGLSAAPANAYSGANAAAYADTWAMSYNSHYMNLGNDCANFVSQSLHAGGIGYEALNQNANSGNSWWMNTAGGTVSYA